MFFTQRVVATGIGSPGQWSQHQPCQSSRNIYTMLSGKCCDLRAVLRKARSWMRMILVNSFQFRIFYDSMIDLNYILFSLHVYLQRNQAHLQVYMGCSSHKIPEHSRGELNTMENTCPALLPQPSLWEQRVPRSALFWSLDFQAYLLFHVKKTMFQRSEHRWVLYIWVLFFNMYNIEFTYSVMFSSFSSSHLPPPHLLSISPLCPACHPILSAAFTTNPLMLYFKSNFQAYDI